MNIEELREFFHYDPLEGVVTWKRNKAPRGRKGERVGYVNTQGYLATSWGGKAVPLTRLVWALTHDHWPDEEVMVRDGDKLNLRLDNLSLRSELTPKGPLTVERLRELLEYNPETGEFRWLNTLGKSRAKARANNAGCQSVPVVGKSAAILRIDGVSFEAARIAYTLMVGEFPPPLRLIDHINGDRLDNRWENLRLVTVGQNAANSLRTSKRSGLPLGVRELKRKCSRQSDFGYVIMAKGVRYAKNGFPTADAAHEAYKAKHLELHGEFSVYARPQA